VCDLFTALAVRKQTYPSIGGIIYTWAQKAADKWAGQIKNSSERACGSAWVGVGAV